MSDIQKCPRPCADLQSVIDRADRGDTRAVSPGANQYDAGFVAGLRRAQEMAAAIAETDSCDISVFLNALNQAIDAEAGKGRG